MDYTVFEYLTTASDIVMNQDWFSLAVKAYNLGLTFFWFMIASWLIDKTFICLNKFYKRGAD